MAAGAAGAASRNQREENVKRKTERVLHCEETKRSDRDERKETEERKRKKEKGRTRKDGRRKEKKKERTVRASLLLLLSASLGVGLLPLALRGGTVAQAVAMAAIARNRIRSDAATFRRRVKKEEKKVLRKKGFCLLRTRSRSRSETAKTNTSKRKQKTNLSLGSAEARTTKEKKKECPIRRNTKEKAEDNNKKTSNESLQL